MQVIIQKEFKTTPEYVELDIDEDGYTMGIYICLGDKIYNMDIADAINFNQLGSFTKIHEILEKNNFSYLLHLGQHYKFLNPSIFFAILVQ